MFKGGNAGLRREIDKALPANCGMKAIPKWSQQTTSVKISLKLKSFSVWKK
jgi:hypothetical protein